MSATTNTSHTNGGKNDRNQGAKNLVNNSTVGNTTTKEAKIDIQRLGAFGVLDTLDALSDTTL